MRSLLGHGRRGVVALLALMLIAGSVSSPAPAGAERRDPARIRWRACHEDVATDTGVVFECARVRVPLDYDRPRGRTISLSLIRVPATDPENRLGAIMTNPGGPGGSGVDFVLDVGPFVSLIFGPEVAQRFDFVGVDPRGIAGSTPIQCFRTADEATGSRPPFVFPLTPEEEAIIEEADAVLARNCSSRLAARRIGQHMSTANVARDLDLIRHWMGDEQLNYFGLSYGSFLGTTYANLFPDRVRSFVLDGIVDPIAYVNLAAEIPAFSRLRSDEGTQETLDRFFELCDQAGPDNCALAPNAADRFAAVADSLLDAPIEATDPDSGETFMITYQDLITVTWASLYLPEAYQGLALFVAELGSFSASPAGIGLARRNLERSVDLDKAGRVRVPYNNVVEGQPAVACVDGDNPTDYAVYSEAGAAADEAFGYFGRLWAWLYSECAQWPFDDTDRYVGPFDAVTANPVLIVGNVYDPATRYESAVTLRSILPSSGLLTVDAPGHTALIAGSQCAVVVMGQYFLDPGVAAVVDGQTCPPEFNPFDPPVGLGAEAATAAASAAGAATVVRPAEAETMAR